MTDCVDGIHSKVDHMANEFDSLKAMMQNLINSQQNSIPSGESEKKIQRILNCLIDIEDKY